MLTVKQENVTKFGTKNEILPFLYHQVTSYGDIIVDSCIISFDFELYHAAEAILRYIY